MNIAIDVETTMAPKHYPWIDGASLVCVSIARDDGHTRTWFFDHPERDRYNPNTTFQDLSREIMEELSCAKRVIGHNLKFDFHWLRAIGVDLSTTTLYCTMIGEYIVNAQRKSEGISLSELSQKYGLPMKKDKVKIYWDAGADTWEVPAHILKNYCEQDTANALALFHKQVPRIRSQRQEKLVSLEMEMLKCVADMEFNGMSIDTELLSRYNSVYGEELEQLDEEFKELLSIENPDSPDQLSKALYGFGEEKGVFNPVKFDISPLKKDGYYSVAMPELAKLKGRTPEQKHILEMLTKRSRLQQLKSTYFEGLAKHVDNGMIHHTINQCITVTGRTSCSRPNLQNQPRGNTGPVKECFVSRY